MGLGLLFIKDRPLYSRNRKSNFCTHKNSAPRVAVVGKLSLFGVYREVFTGKDWMVRKLHLLSFCSGGTHVGLCVSSLNPSHGIPVLQQGQAVPCCFCSQVCLGLSFLSRESSFVFPFPPPQAPGMVQGVFGSSQAALVWAMTELERCRRIKRSFSNKCNYTNMLEPCVLFNSSPRKFLRALLLCESKRYPSASGILWIHSGSLCPGWQLILGFRFL